MNKIPEVAIITRTKNRNLLLGRAFESVLNQSFTDWQMIIVNSGDDTQAVDNIVSKYKDRLNDKIKVIHDPTSLGLQVALNTGIKNSESKYIVIHDDDDSWEEDFLKECIDVFNSDKEIMGVVTQSSRIIETINDGKVTALLKEPLNPWLETVSLYRMAVQNVMPPISFIFKREVIDKIGYFNEELPVLEDWEFYLRFLENYDIYVIKKALANYHLRTDIKSGSYGNTVIAGINKHAYYDTKIRNAMLRKDLKEGWFGLGYLVNFARGNQVNYFEKEKNHTQNKFANLKKTDFKEKLDNFIAENKDKKVCFYGAGQFAEDFAVKHDLSGLNVLGFIDKNPMKAGKNIGNYTIYNPESLTELKPDIIVLCVAEAEHVIHSVVNLINSCNLKTSLISDLFN